MVEFKNTFAGCDWTELAEAWGIPINRGETEVASDVRQYMWEHVTPDGADSQIVADLRAFVTRLIEEEHGYDAPLWRGLLSIEHDAVFVRYCCILLEHMWT